tara:strand:+ start:290 stop:574 length:285 start_codon:yes stop_codon:yes gene_type:complete
MDFEKITRKFLLGEWKRPAKGPSGLAYARAIKETIESFNLRTIKERHRAEVALENLQSMRKDYRRLEEQNVILTEENQQLNEKLQVLEESRGSE